MNGLGTGEASRPLQNAAERGLSHLLSGDTAKKVVDVLGDAVLVTLAAQITTLPILVGGSNSPSSLVAALGQRMPYWDRDIDRVAVPRDDARSLNGLLAVVDRYRMGQIVAAKIDESRAGLQWLDAITAKSIHRRRSRADRAA